MDELIAGILRGDLAAISKIQKDCLPFARKLVNQYGGVEEDAQDLFGDTIEFIYKKAQTPGFILTSKFSTYFYGVAFRLLGNRMQKKSATKITFDDGGKYTLSGAEIPDAGFAEADKNRLFLRAMDDVGDLCRQVLRLFFEGKQFREIGQLLNLGTDENARRRKFTCQKRLYDLIKSYPEFDELMDD